VVINENFALDDFTLVVYGRKLELELIYAETEKQLIEGFQKIMDYILQNAIPLLNSFNDLRVLVSRINGEGDNY
jgi:hypothetical protein